MPAGALRIPRKVRFSDCDPAGILYTPRYVDMMNGVIEDFFPEALGLDYHGLIRDRRLGMGYAQLHCEFFRPSMMGDQLDFTVLIGRIGRGSVAIRQHAHKGDDEVVRGDFVLVTTNLDLHKPVRIPPDLHAALTAYQDRCQ
jgi:4-hydroxybenzoyl-CoA thioesterase